MKKVEWGVEGAWSAELSGDLPLARFGVFAFLNIPYILETSLTASAALELKLDPKVKFSKLSHESSYKIEGTEGALEGTLTTSAGLKMEVLDALPWTEIEISGGLNVEGSIGLKGPIQIGACVVWLPYYKIQPPFLEGNGKVQIKTPYLSNYWTEHLSAFNGSFKLEIFEDFLSPIGFEVTPEMLDQGSTYILSVCGQ